MDTRYVGFALQFAPIIIIPKPNQIAVLIGNLVWDADLVAVEVVGLLAVFAVFVDVVLIGETTYVLYTPYVRTKDFVQVTACYSSLVITS